MRALALAGALVVLVAGCGGETEIDTERAEEEIARAIRAQTGIGVREVVCPDDVVAEANVRFHCVARGTGGGEARVEVVQTDDEGNIRFSAPDLSALAAPGTATTPDGSDGGE